jgi:hypothetical protein
MILGDESRHKMVDGWLERQWSELQVWVGLDRTFGYRHSEMEDTEEQTECK